MGDAVSAFHSHRKNKIDSIFDEFKACPPAPGFKEVMIPGEIEQNCYDDNAAHGIALSEPVIQELTGLAEQYGLQNPFK